MNGITRREREVTDINEIIKILDKATIIRIGMVDEGECYIVPMNYGYTLNEGKLTFWLHSGLKGKKLNIIRKNPKIFFELDCDISPFEGDIACRYGITYSSVMGRGTAVITEDAEEKKYGLSLLMKTQTGKNFIFDDKMVSIVNVIRIDVSDYTAKRRPHPAEQKIN